MSDARFEDGSEAPLRLIARDDAGLQVMSALLQDAVFPISEMAYVRRARRFALLLNRFRWEDVPAAERHRRPFERVRSLLVFQDVLAVQTSGIDRGQGDMVLSLLSLAYTPGAEGRGRVELILAGDGAVALQLDALDATLEDVSRPYRAPSGRRPDHPL